MGSCSSRPVIPTKTQSERKSIVDVEEARDWRAVHSAIRWNKTNRVNLLFRYPETLDCVDESNGNRPIHIAAQNGHKDIIQMLLEKGTDLNVQNKKGNTALHMAIGYDYHQVAKILIDAGADIHLKNHNGHEALHGLDGDKSLALIALIETEKSKDPEKILKAFKHCEHHTSDLNKANFVATGLKLKKLLEDKWTPEMQTLFQTIIDKCH